MKNLKKKAMRAAAARISFLESIKNLKEQLSAKDSVKLKDALGSLPPIQQLAFETSLKQVQAKCPQGMRYTRMWVTNCLLLRIASPKAYGLLRSMKLLPLPTSSRLNQIVSGVPCEYGYNAVALETIQAFFKDKPGVQRCGTLVLDEIKLKESVDFNRSTYKFDGFVDFSNTAGQSRVTSADHALVIMFIPLFHKWVQPVASFATKGAAPGFVLAKLVLECVLQLERHSASVIAVVSDGSGNNKSMWTHLGVSGKLANPFNKIPHPTLEDGRFLHFLCDVPHIIKCVRNHLLSHTYAKAGPHCINFKHYQQLYETEKKAQLKVVPKLTHSHVNPGKLEKMNVRLAAQLLSRSVAIGLKFYREQGEPDFEGTEGTEMFTLLTNDLFDTLNAKCPMEGIRRNSPKIKNPAPYSLGYDPMGRFNNQLFGTGQDGSGIFAARLYGYPDATSPYRQMNYADAMQGFPASFGNVGANNQRAAHGVSNTAAFNTAPTIRPVLAGSPQEAAAAAYGPRTSAPNTGGYGAYDRTTADPYVLAARAFEYAQYGRFGYGSSEAAPSGPSASNFSPYGPTDYAAGYIPGANTAVAAYGNRRPSYHSYRSR
ncbi:hypothetical protein MTO96_015125 [Rhipicephalus appendiculatus]